MHRQILTTHNPQSAESPSPNSQAINSDFEFAALSEARQYRRALLDSFRPHLHGEVLEVGAGIGQFTTEITSLPAVANLTAVEPDPKFYDTLARKLPPAQIVTGSAGAYQLDPKIGWDSIVSINVLEHIEEDQVELGVYCRLLAKRNGTLCLFVPARGEIYAQLDRDFGHFRRYGRINLREKLQRAGFEIITLRYYNFAGYFAWWFTFCLMGRRHFNPSAVRWFDRCIFPAVFWFETHIFAPPLGQSLLAIARPKSVPPAPMS
jgi:SAM-dependent methyltransferase